MKKNILSFGSTSFLAKAFQEREAARYHITGTSRSGSGTGVHFDFDDLSDRALSELLQAIPPAIHGVIFFQGANPSVGFRDMTETHFDRMFRLNVGGPALVLKALADRLAADASVIFFSSVAVRKGSYDPAYAAAKSAIPGLVQSLANALPAVRVNAISLGLVEGSPVHEGMTPDFRLKHSGRMFMNRLITPDQVLDTLVLLLENGGINRSVIPVDGGYS